MTTTESSKSMWATALGALMLAACSNDPPKHYVLVHGAWSNHAAWDGVAAHLRQAGATVDAFDLPGHGSDTTPLAQLSLAAYVARVDQAIDAAGRDVIVVGHSMAGIPISQAGQDRASKIHSLVYLGAYVPAPGQSLFALAQSDQGSHIGPALQMKGATLGIDPAMFPALFCGDCNASERAAMVAGYADEPAGPLAESVALGGDFDRLRKTYIHTANDQVISPSLQDMMTQTTPVARTHDVETSHMAMFVDPDGIAELLLME
jgi:pimeloyl-ACP methyl ester carboxylesterase